MRCSVHSLAVTISSIMLLISMRASAQGFWEISISRNDHYSYDLDCWEDGNCVATITEGIDNTSYILHSSDRGVTWRRVHEDLLGGRGRRPLRYNAIEYLSATDVLVTADSGVLLRSSDAGRTWTEDRIGWGMSGRAGDLAISPGQTGLLTIKRDVPFEAEPPQDLLYSTTDHGKSWYLLPNQPRDDLYARESPITFVSAPAEGHYLVGFTSTFYFDSTFMKRIGDSTVMFAYSTDTGSSWSYHTLDHDSIMFIRAPSMSFFDADRGVLTGSTKFGYSRGIVAHTYDGGRNWIVIREGASESGRESFGINHSRFVTFDTGYGAIGERIARTYDGGLTWQYDSVPFVPVFGFQGALRTYMFSDSVGVGMSGTGAMYYFNGETSSIRYPTPLTQRSKHQAYSVRKDEGMAVIPLSVDGERPHLRLYDLHGRLVEERHEIAGGNVSSGGVVLDLSRLRIGTYVMTLTGTDGEQRRAVLLVH